MGLIAIREDEDAAGVMGVNTTLYKIMALILASLFTAVAGGINAYWSPSSIRPGPSTHAERAHGHHGDVRRAGNRVRAGVRRLRAVGGLRALASWISTAAALLFGLVIVLSVIFMPRGLADLSPGSGGGSGLSRAQHPAAPAMNAAPHPLLLETRGLTKRFQGLVSVDNVSFSLSRGRSSP